MKKIKKYNLIAKKKDNRLDINIKMFYIPYILNWICPYCNLQQKLDLERYAPLMYPQNDIPMRCVVSCKECEEESEFKLTFKARFEITAKNNE